MASNLQTPEHSDALLTFKLDCPPNPTTFLLSCRVLQQIDGIHTPQEST